MTLRRAARFAAIPLGVLYASRRAGPSADRQFHDVSDWAGCPRR